MAAHIHKQITSLILEGFKIFLMLGPMDHALGNSSQPTLQQGWHKKPAKSCPQGIHP